MFAQGARGFLGRSCAKERELKDIRKVQGQGKKRVTLGRGSLVLAPEAQEHGVKERTIS